MIKVSVLVMTYNHEKFIRQALDSVLQQKANFDFEIVISEDASTDLTRNILEEYYYKYPEKIRLLLSEKNLHNNKIVVRGIEAAAGIYIALLDGDDYWISPHKLQKQVDFLDLHPECSICFHNAMVIDESKQNQQWNWTPPHVARITNMEDLWLGNYIATSSTMFRKGVITKIPECYTSFFPITDWPLHLFNAEHGNIGLIDETMSVYRYHSGGMYSPFSESAKQDETLRFYNNMNKCFNYRYDKIIKIAISKYFYEWAEEYIKRNDYNNARRCIGIYFNAKPLNKYISSSNLIKLLLNFYCLRRSVITTVSASGEK